MAFSILRREAEKEREQKDLQTRQRQVVPPVSPQSKLVQEAARERGVDVKSFLESRATRRTIDQTTNASWSKDRATMWARNHGLIDTGEDDFRPTYSVGARNAAGNISAVDVDSNRYEGNLIPTRKDTAPLSDYDGISSELEMAGKEYEAADQRIYDYINENGINYKENPGYQALVYARNQARERYYNLKSRKELAEYLVENRADNFKGQYDANRDVGEITEKINLAYNDYLNDPTPEKLEYARQLDELLELYLEKNAAVLDDEGAVLPWITKDLAGYMPQFWGQTGAGLKGAAAGGLTTGAATSWIPGVNAGGFVWGARGGYTLGVGKYSYDTMRGAAYRTLIQNGVDEETARAAASDEALVSALIEMVDAGVDIATLFTGKIVGTAARKAANVLIRYGINIWSEAAEEAGQELVSISNADRINSGNYDPNAGWFNNSVGLGVDTGKLLGDVIARENTTALDQALEAAWQGAKLAAMTGGATLATTSTINTISANRIGRDIQSSGGGTVQTLIDLGLTAEQKTESYKIANYLAKKMESGKEIGNTDVGWLYRALQEDKVFDQKPTTNRVQAESEVSRENGSTYTLEQLAREAVAERENGAQSASATLMELARETVAERNASQQAQAERTGMTVQTAPVAENTEMQEISPVQPAVDTKDYGDLGVKVFEQYVTNAENSEQAARQFDAAYKLGEMETPREKVSLENKLQEAAYEAGLLDTVAKKPPIEQKPVENTGEQEYTGGEQTPQTATKPKKITTKKSDWAAHDVQWTIPGKKTPIAYSTVSTSDTISVLADENPTATINDLRGLVTYDMEAKKVLQQYIDAGYGDQVANEWFSYDKSHGYTRSAADGDAAVNAKEDVNNGEAILGEVSDEGRVLESDLSGQSDGGLLDEVASENLQEDARGRDSVSTSEENGRESSGLAGGDDTRRTGGGRSLGSDQGTDLQPAAGEVSEFDADGNPVFAKTREEAKVEATDHAALKETRKNAAAEYGLTEKEQVSLEGYISTTFGLLNKRLYTGTLPAKDIPVVERLKTALGKFPTFEGRTYRNLKFESETEYSDFLSKYAEGTTVTLDAFTSTSKRPNGYPKYGKYVVHMVIDGKTGADIADTYGVPRQQEVILLPGTTIEIPKVTTANDGHPLIYAQEVAANDLGRDYEDERSLRSPETDRGESGQREPGDRGNGSADSTVREAARDNGGSDGILSERGESSEQVNDDTAAEVEQKTELATQEPARGNNFSIPEDGLKLPKGDSEDSTDDMVDLSKARSTEGVWSAERVGEEKKPMRLSEIIEKIRHDFGINITTGHIRSAGVLGRYNQQNHGIRTRIANHLPTVAHELGHHLDTTYSLTDEANLTEELKNELLDNLDQEMKDNYKENQWVREGMAEFLRNYLENHETAAIDYPEFTKYFINSLSTNDATLIAQLADEINAYYALDADTATSSIRLGEEKNPDTSTWGEKIRAKASSLYQAWVDANHGIKLFDEATGSNAYTLANNAAYSDAMAGQIITSDLTDANGQYVAAGLKTALNGVNLNDKTEYRLFGEYLTVKHGPERLREGMRIFADDRKNSSAFMERRTAELEAKYPQFKEASERLYEFQSKFLQTWGVDTGLVAKESADKWAKRWKYYVPLNRAVSEGKRGIGAKRGFANQNSTIKKARGSGLDIVHPVDNIINNIVKMVNAGVRNNVMRVMTDSAGALGADAAFMEQVPTPLVRRGFDMTGTKERLIQQMSEIGLSEKDLEEAEGILAETDDVLYQYGKGKAHGDVITVMKGGKQEFWKINDPLLLKSVTTMSPSKVEGVLDGLSIIHRFMTANITGNNIVWSLFSNYPRDLMTLFTYSKTRNPLKVFGAMGSAYINKVGGSFGRGLDPLYREYVALGGGSVSAYTADRDLAKRAREKLSGKKFSVNPLNWIAYTSDVIETGPRYATYKLLRENGVDPQEAFAGAMDITVNFRRGGRISRELNKAIPFFNVSVQGLDKFRRWISAEDAGKHERKKVVRSRVFCYMAASAALAALTYAINNGDEEEEKNYQQLSNYQKNSYWNIPLGEGKYFAIPKPRELAVLSSFMETAMEYTIGDNNHAFDEFYDYASSNLLPKVASDIAAGVGTTLTEGLGAGFDEMRHGVLGNLGIFGTLHYMGANRDFLGKPIVSAGLQVLEAKDQYTERTSKIAYWVGQAFNASPQMIDFFFQQTLGGFWKGLKALLPVGKENIDWTLGVQNAYIKDNQYTTDIVNWMYDQAEKSSAAANSDRGNMDKAITARMDANMTSFYSKFYAISKNEKESNALRGSRQTVLNMLLEYRKATDSGYLTDTQQAVYEIVRKEGNTEYLPSVMQTTVKDGDDKEHALSPEQYVEYQTDYLRLYWEYVEDNMLGAKSYDEKIAILKAAKTVARENATSRTLGRIGATTSSFSVKYQGVEANDIIDFMAGVILAGKDGSVKQAEVVDIIMDMSLSDDNAWTLYFSRYDGKAAHEAQKYGISAELYMAAKIELENIRPDYDWRGREIEGSRRGKVERYLKSVCDNYKEYLFLLGTVYDSVKDDRDYKNYFG